MGEQLSYAIEKLFTNIGVIWRQEIRILRRPFDFSIPVQIVVLVAIHLAVATCARGRLQMLARQGLSMRIQIR